MTVEVGIAALHDHYLGGRRITWIGDLDAPGVLELAQKEISDRRRHSAAKREAGISFRIVTRTLSEPQFADELEPYDDRRHSVDGLSHQDVGKRVIVRVPGKPEMRGVVVWADSKFAGVRKWSEPSQRYLKSVSTHTRAFVEFLD